MTAALAAVGGPIEEMGVDHLRLLKTAGLAIDAAQACNLPLPVRLQIDDCHVVFFFTRRADLAAWSRWVEEPITKNRLITGRSIAGVDVVLMGVPFRLICGKPVA